MKNKKNKAERIKKTRRAMAMIGLIVIVLLYVYFFVLAFRNDPNMQQALFAAFAATIIVPAIMYAFGLMTKNMIDYAPDETYGEDTGDGDLKNEGSDNDSCDK